MMQTYVARVYTSGLEFKTWVVEADSFEEAMVLAQEYGRVISLVLDRRTTLR